MNIFASFLFGNMSQAGNAAISLPKVNKNIASRGSPGQKENDECDKKSMC